MVAKGQLNLGRLKVIALVGLLTLLLIPFQNCINPNMTGIPNLAANVGGDGLPFRGTLVPEGEYVRRYEGFGCNDVQARAVSDGKDLILREDNCDPINYRIPDEIVDFETYNLNVFGLGMAIMRKTTSEPDRHTPYDIAFCRQKGDFEATDYMVWYSPANGYTNTTIIRASRDSTEDEWETWPQTISRYGHPYGYGGYADHREVSIPLNQFSRTAPNPNIFVKIEFKTHPKNPYAFIGRYENTAHNLVIPNLECRLASEEPILKDPSLWTSPFEFYEGPISGSPMGRPQMFKRTDLLDSYQNDPDPY